MDAANSYITQSVLTVGSGTADEREASALTSDGSVDKFDVSSEDDLLGL